MLWFKHSSDARNSLKLRKVRRKYGADGYAIYWFCLEAIAQEVDKDNLTFNLKEDAETIGFELTIQEKRVEEIMKYMVDIGLFESSNSMITCMKLAERLDKSMTNSPKMRKWLAKKDGQALSVDVMTCADDVMTSGDSVSTCAELDKNRIEKNRIDNKNIIHSTSEEIGESPKKSEDKKPYVQATPKHSEWDMEFAVFAYQTISQKLPDFKKPNLETWAKDCRLMRERDNRNENLMGEVWQWARNDNFWSSNILSIKKFREKFDQLNAQRLKPANTGYQTANEKAAAQIAKSLSCDKPEDFLF